MAGRKQTEEVSSLGGSAASGSSGSTGSRSARAAHNAMPAPGSKGAVRPSMVGTIATPRFPSEPAPAAPGAGIERFTSVDRSRDKFSRRCEISGVAPAATAEHKSQAFGLAARSNLHSSTAEESLAKTKQAEERYTETVISTPDSDIFYRIAKGGFVEISEDGGHLARPAPESLRRIRRGIRPRTANLLARRPLGVVFLTEDGKSWRKLPSPTSEDLVAVVAKSASNATVTANDDRKWSTDDSGKSWHAVK